MVQTELKLDPHSGVTVIFRSKRGGRLKILVWDGTGMVMIYNVLEQGNFAWPKVQDGTMRLSRAQFEALFEGLDWRRVMVQRVAAPAAAGWFRHLFWHCFIELFFKDRVERRMSQPFDLSQFPDLPPEVVKAFAAQKTQLETAQFEASVERAARQHEQAVVAEKDAFITELKGLIEKLEGQVQDYRRAKFGPKSEKLDPTQLELALEDLETSIAETQAQIACGAMIKVRCARQSG